MATVDGCESCYNCNPPHFVAKPMRLFQHSCSAGIALLSLLPAASQACTLTSQVNPAIKIQFASNPNYAFVKGSVDDGGTRIASVGDWICGSGGTCGFYGGSAGEGQIIGMRNGQPTNGTGERPTAYLFSGLSLGDKWNTRLRASSRGLWLRGKTCTGRWYDMA